MKRKILIIVILVIVVSFFIIPGSLAIYRNIVNSNDNIASAQWNVVLNQSSVNNYISVVAGDSTSSASYTINITSTSEVDITYSIIVNDIPSGVTVALDNGSFETPTNGTVIFSNVSTINYSDINKTKSHSLTFKAASGATYVTDEEIDIDVVARQLLANE